MRKACMQLMAFFFCFFISASSVSAEACHFPNQKPDEIIRQLYHSFIHNLTGNMQTRVKGISQLFLGRPYCLGALGEGADARFDQSPLYRTDSFDCETYVDTVLALALANDEVSFKHCINRIRYSNSSVDFKMRNHFAGLDWNQNNQKKGYLKDITNTIKDEKNKPVSQVAMAVIDKPSWYQKLKIDRIQIAGADEKLREDALKRLHQEGINLPIEKESIPYIPLSRLFNKSLVADRMLFSQIPDGAIIEIVRPDWNIKKIIGTNMNVSHLGFAFWSDGKLWFRQASSTQGKVLDVLLIDYLKAALQSSPSIKGINVQAIVPDKPLTQGC